MSLSPCFARTLKVPFAEEGVRPAGVPLRDEADQEHSSRCPVLFLSEISPVLTWTGQCQKSLCCF